MLPEVDVLAFGSIFTRVGRVEFRSTLPNPRHKNPRFQSACQAMGVNLSREIAMIRESTPPNDDYLIRCPRLGHQIYFSYCRRENQGLPCFKALDCWYSHFLVEEYFRRELSPEEWEKAFTRSDKTKTVSLVELIEQAKKSARKAPSSGD